MPILCATFNWLTEVTNLTSWLINCLSVCHYKTNSTEHSSYWANNSYFVSEESFHSLQNLKAHHHAYNRIHHNIMCQSKLEQSRICINLPSYSRDFNGKIDLLTAELIRDIQTVIFWKVASCSLLRNKDLWETSCGLGSQTKTPFCTLCTDFLCLAAFFYIQDRTSTLVQI
jgi:hypothetical protein